MNIAYFGSPKIAADLLYKLIKNQESDHNIACIFTMPDKKAGKKLELTQTEVKRLALRESIKVYDMDLKSSQDEVISLIKEEKIDLGLVFAYGALIPDEILNCVTYGFWNIHPSLLPKYRGPSPIIYPLVLGDKESGVSIIKMTNKIDSGPILRQEKIQIESNTRLELENRLIELAWRMLNELVPKQSDNKLTFTPQNGDNVTQTRLIQKEDGFISKAYIQKALNNENLTFEELPTLIREYGEKYLGFDRRSSYPASITLYNCFQGLSPWPGLWTIVTTNKGERRLKIISLKSNRDRSFEIDQVQLEGKKTVAFKIFNDAYNIFKVK